MVSSERYKALEHPKNIAKKKLQTLEYILETKSTLYDKNSLRYLKKFSVVFSPNGTKIIVFFCSQRKKKKREKETGGKENLKKNYVGLISPVSIFLITYFFVLRDGQRVKMTS